MTKKGGDRMKLSHFKRLRVRNHSNKIFGDLVICQERPAEVMERGFDSTQGMVKIRYLGTKEEEWKGTKEIQDY